MQLIALTALVRRYIHVLAADIVLAPSRPHDPQADKRQRADAGRSEDRNLFPLIETPSRPSRASAGEDPTDLPPIAATRLAEVLANPAPHARRLARRFATLLTPGPRDLPVPSHVTRRLSPQIDVLICRLDAAARPEAWAALDTS